MPSVAEVTPKSRTADWFWGARSWCALLQEAFLFDKILTGTVIVEVAWRVRTKCKMPVCRCSGGGEDCANRSRRETEPLLCLAGSGF